jgi:3-oxoacyl-[acyl-carrier-protein] synthase II
MRARIGGEVRGLTGLLPGVERVAQLALLAAREASEQAGIGAGPWGISVGTVSGGGCSAQVLARQLGFSGRRITVSNACAAGATALACGADLVRQGKHDVVLAGGAEAFELLTFSGFHALRSLDPLCCRPFDAARQGLVIGEGAAFLILEERERALRRGADIWAEFAGYGLTGDAYHETAPDPSGRGAARAIKAALTAARLDRSEIDYYNAHGTGTPQNDAMETRALKRVFGVRATKLPVSSSKSMIGHLMGAAGAVEALASVLAIRYSFIPPTINYKKRDPECDLDYVPNQARSRPLRAVLSANFGFGGSNAVLAFKK